MRFGYRAFGVASIVLAVLAAVLLYRQAASNLWLVARLDVVAVFALALGIAFRSERLVAMATAPMAIGLLAGAGTGETVAWGSSLVVGFVWFLAFEAATASIDWRVGGTIAPAVLHRRLSEVAMVVALGSSVGLIGLLVASWAPERSIATRVALLAAVVAALVAGGRHLAATTPAPRSTSPSEEG